MSRLPRRLIGLSASTALLATLVVSPTVHAASTLYVGLGGGPGGCASPAYTTIAGAVAAAVDGDTIHICAGTYALTSAVGVPVNLTFVGDGAASTIVDGGGTVQLFSASLYRSLTFSGLTLRNGKTADYGLGAAIAAGGGAVHVSNSTFTGNATGYGAGGGAIWGEYVTVTTSTFSGNTAGAGGAIYASDNATVSNSTFSANGAQYQGGAIWATHVYATNTTFSGNTTQYGTAAALAGPTVNGGTLKNTIVSGSGPGCGTTTFSDGGGNLTTDASCPGTVTTIAGLALGALADNGGPTQTVALGETSSALDAGVDATCAAAPVDGVDQRGVTRPQGAHCDSGAFELVPSQKPEIWYVEPSQGPIGTRVLIRGDGFTGATAASINGTALTGLQVVWDGTILGRVAVGTTSGKVSVTVGGTTVVSKDPFIVTFAPAVKSVSPRAAKVGDTVTVTGVGFSWVKSVTIGGKTAKFTIGSPTAIFATVPAGAVTGPITVTSPYGTATSVVRLVVLP